MGNMRKLWEEGADLLVSLYVHKVILIGFLAASLTHSSTLLLTFQPHPYGHLGGSQIERAGCHLGPPLV